MTASTSAAPLASSGRHPAIDWLKCLAILAVVLTHSGLTAFPGTPGWTAWDTVFRHLLPSFHVPCLLMISGYLYYRPRPIGWRETWPRLQRILLPYFVASMFVFALLPNEHPTLQAKALALLGASALSIYYYVFLLVVFVALLPVISRLSVNALRILVACVFVALVSMCFVPSLRLSLNPYWGARNPVESFTLAYFVLGWIAAAESTVAPRSNGRLGFAGMLVAAGAWPLCIAYRSPYPMILVAKIPYALTVWNSAWRFLDSRPAPALVRWISDATYGIFLYHFLALYPFRIPTSPWPAPLRIAMLTAAGIGGGLLFGVIARRVLGPDRARRWFGY